MRRCNRVVEVGFRQLGLFFKGRQAVLERERSNLSIERLEQQDKIGGILVGRQRWR